MAMSTVPGRAATGAGASNWPSQPEPCLGTVAARASSESGSRDGGAGARLPNSE